MKCLDKKRIKLKSGESMAINERVILSRVSSGVSSVYLTKIRKMDVRRERERDMFYFSYD